MGVGEKMSVDFFSSLLYFSLMIDLLLIQFTQWNYTNCHFEEQSDEKSYKQDRFLAMLEMTKFRLSNNIFE